MGADVGAEAGIDEGTETDVTVEVVAAVDAEADTGVDAETDVGVVGVDVGIYAGAGVNGLSTVDTGAGVEALATADEEAGTDSVAGDAVRLAPELSAPDAGTSGAREALGPPAPVSN